MFANCLNNPIRLGDFTGMRAVDVCVAQHLGNGSGPQPAPVSPIAKFTTKVTEMVNDAVEAVNGAIDFVTNDDPQKVLDAEYCAFYKGALVVKVPFMDREAASFGIIFLGSNAGHRTDADQIVQHEYGHTVQMANMGVTMYSIAVAVPSVIGNRVDASGNMPFNYYSQPWEYGADIYGGVTGRAYDNWAYWVYPIYAMTTSTLRSIFPNWP